MSEEELVYTIFDRPIGIRVIGLTQMVFGFFGLLAAIGVFAAFLLGEPSLVTMGPVYSLLIFVGVALPCLLIGNYVDDLRRKAVIAQILYSIIAIGLTWFFLYNWGLDYHWGVPLFGPEFNIAIGNVALFVNGTQTVFLVYLIARWNRIAPTMDHLVVRDRAEARIVSQVVHASPLAPSLLGPDGETELSPDEAQRIMDVLEVTTDEGMAILCSNCGGATPLTKIENNNTVHCDYCSVTLAVSGVFVPCTKHSEYLAATSCAVCGDHFCRRCLTAQDPPVDKRWKGSTIHLCRNCFEGRYRPAVTTTSLVLPIEDLFGQAGGRFSRVGGMYRRFLGAYGRTMASIMKASLDLVGSFLRMGGGRSGGGFGSSGGRGGGGGGDDCASVLVFIVIIIVAIPVIIGIVMLLGAIVIVPILFYAGLVGVTIEALRVISKTDFVSLEEARKKGIVQGKKVEVQDSRIRDIGRPWVRDDRLIRRAMKHRDSRDRPEESYWGKQM
ncbi:MAG: hypothetical protein ACFE7R_04815 [Candidatus Hodarchaeota archaeon]